MDKEGLENIIANELKEINEKLGQMLNQVIRLEERHEARDSTLGALDKRVEKLEDKVEAQGNNIVKLLTLVGSGGILGAVISQFMAK